MFQILIDIFSCLFRIWLFPPPPLGGGRTVALDKEDLQKCVLSVRQNAPLVYGWFRSNSYGYTYCENLEKIWQSLSMQTQTPMFQPWSIMSCVSLCNIYRTICMVMASPVAMSTPDFYLVLNDNHVNAVANNDAFLHTLQGVNCTLCHKCLLVS